MSKFYLLLYKCKYLMLSQEPEFKAGELSLLVLWKCQREAARKFIFPTSLTKVPRMRQIQNLHFIV